MADGGWRVRLTASGTVHMVRKQDNPNSCGIACALMVNYKMKKGGMLVGLAASAGLAVPLLGASVGVEMMRLAVDYAVKSEPEVYRAYEQVSGRSYDGTDVIGDAELPDLLRLLKLGEWETVVVPPNRAGDYLAGGLSMGGPVIASVSWSNGNNHAVVIDTVAGRPDLRQFFVCDPGDGEVHGAEARRGAEVRYREVGRLAGRFCARKGPAVPPPVPYNPARR